MFDNLNYLTNAPDLNTTQFADLLIDAYSALGELKGACYGLPNPQLLLSPAIMREALESSGVENIITTLANVIQARLLPDAERDVNDREVIRYSQAINVGVERMKESYLGTNVIRAVHAVLIPNEPDIRTSSNCLRNALTGEIVYTPPSANLVDGYMADLERFVNESQMDKLLKTAIAHYQFESIHPFGDGNGRTGRILIILCLISYGLLDLPTLFISEYINTNKALYYDAFNAVRQRGDWPTFINYILRAITEQAKKSTDTLLAIKELRRHVKWRVRDKLPNIYSSDLIDTIFAQPEISPTKYAELLRCTRQTATSHLKQLEEIDVMSHDQIGRNAVYTNVELMKLLTK